MLLVSCEEDLRNDGFERPFQRPGHRTEANELVYRAYFTPVAAAHLSSSRLTGNRLSPLHEWMSKQVGLTVESPPRPRGPSPQTCGVFTRKPCCTLCT